MKVIGVTGGIGSGKTTVARMLRRRGVRVIDADKMAHRLLEDPDCCSRIVRCFGKDVLTDRGRIDRARLGTRVFRDSRKLARLEKILHPRIRAGIRSALACFREQGVSAAVLDVPLLFETGLDRLADVVIVVKARREDQIRRVQTAAGLSKAGIRRRMASQWPESEKIKRADYVVDNTGPLEETRDQVREIWKQITTVLR